MSSRIVEVLKRLGGYFTASLLGTAVDTLVLWLCSHFLFSGSYFGRNILSPTLSFECAMLVNFCSSFFVVWKDRLANHGTRSFWKHYAAYNASCTGGFLLKIALLQLVVLITHLDVVWCNLIALCFSGLFNFTMNDKVIFKRNKRKNPDASLHSKGTATVDPETEG